MTNTLFHGRRNTNGRPCLNEWVRRKYKLPAVKMNTDEYFSVKEKAKIAGVTLTEFIRQSVLFGGVIETVTPEQMDLIRDLAGMGNNLNQLAKQANTYGYTLDADYFHAQGEKIASIIDKVKATLSQ